MLRSDTACWTTAQLPGSPFITAVPWPKPNILNMIPTYIPTHSYIYISNPINLAISLSNFSVCLSVYLSTSIPVQTLYAVHIPIQLHSSTVYLPQYQSKYIYMYIGLHIKKEIYSYQKHFLLFQLMHTIIKS